MTTTEGNAAIAKGSAEIALFMQMEKPTWSAIANDFLVMNNIGLAGIQGYTPIKFHSSWDWLHGAWGRAREVIGAWAEEQGDDVKETWEWSEKDMSSAMVHNDIAEAFECLTDIITYYNDNKTNE